MGHRDGAGAETDRCARHRRRAEVEPRRERTDDIDDRIDRAHLVEVDVVDVDPVHGGLGDRETSERGASTVAHRLGERGGADHRVDRRPAPVVVVIGGGDGDRGGGDAPAGGQGRVEGPLGQADRADEVADHVELGTEVDERGEEHVAGDADGRVDPQAHRVVQPRMRHAAHAAP